MLAKMLKIAADAHANQYDKAGKPYFLHCMEVMYLLGDADTELQQIALGHDLFEDTLVTGIWLEKEGISKRVIDGIKSLTKQRGQSYEEYKDQVKANPDAIKVKLADLTHNSDIRRMKEVSQKDFDRTIKYRQFYDEITKVLKND